VHKCVYGVKVLLQEVPAKSEVPVAVTQTVLQTASVPVSHTVKQPTKSVVTKPIKRCVTKLVSVLPPNVTDTNDHQVMKGLPSKPNLVQPTIRRLTTIQLPPPAPVASAVQQVSPVIEEPMDTDEVLYSATGRTSDTPKVAIVWNDLLY